MNFDFMLIAESVAKVITIISCRSAKDQWLMAQ